MFIFSTVQIRKKRGPNTLAMSTRICMLGAMRRGEPGNRGQGAMPVISILLKSIIISNFFLLYPFTYMIID